jgi:1,4-alpha-glucan branching enzyme
LYSADFAVGESYLDSMRIEDDNSRVARGIALHKMIPQLLHEDSAKKVIIFKRAALIFAFNFNPYQSFTDYRFEAPPGKYRMILDCDAPKYGGYGRLFPQQNHFTTLDNAEAKSQHVLSLYLPARSAFVLSPTI